MMEVHIHPHAYERLAERGATEEEIVLTVQTGERFAARFGRTGFRRNLPFKKRWRGKRYKTKQVEAYAIRQHDGWLVISAVTRYF